ncbi:MAG: SDR family oxidoreductase [Chloroflexi bacterium]|nr:SDR family oxidoreductase [Chloroflexota bacterium]
MPKWLEGRTALVTGASRGIGVGIAVCLAKEGAKVALASRTVSGLEAAAAEVRKAGGEALVVPADVTKEADVAAMVRAVEKKWDQVDILVNNAGAMGGPGWNTVWPERPHDWEHAFRVNTLSRVLAINAVAESMKKRTWGRIINIASPAGLEGVTLHVAYAATKAAEINYTQAMAKELGKFNITVNAVLPGLVYTEISNELWHQLKLKHGERLAGDDPKKWFDGLVTRQIPLGRAQTAEDIGWMCVFLCSELARNITGQAINVDGGMKPH